MVLEVSHPALGTYLPEAHQAVLAAAIEARKPDLVVLENTTAGYRPRGRRGGHGGASLRRLLRRGCRSQGGQVEATSGIYGGQLQATARTPLPAVIAVNSTALHEEPQACGPGERVGSDPPPALDNLRTTFVEARGAGRRGRRPDARPSASSASAAGSAEPRTSRSPRSWPRRSDAELAGSRPVIDSGWLPKVRQIGKSGARVQAQAVPQPRRLGCA